MSTLTLRETRIVETDLNGIYVTDGKELYFMTAEQDNMPINPREYSDYCTICYVQNRSIGADRYTHDKEFDSSDDLSEYLQELKENGTEFVAMKLYVLDHSGISISVLPFYDPWDSWCCGVAICTKAEVIEAYGNDTDWQQHAKKLITDEVETYNKYITGETYVYSTYLYNKETKEWTLEDTCSGFYSNDEDEMFSSYFGNNYRIIGESEAKQYE